MGSSMEVLSFAGKAVELVSMSSPRGNTDKRHVQMYRINGAALAYFATGNASARPALYQEGIPE